MAAGSVVQKREKEISKRCSVLVMFSQCMWRKDFHSKTYLALALLGNQSTVINSRDKEVMRYHFGT
jgi:hypothetical protein